MPLAAFHPAVAAWFASAFPAPTEAQVLAWPAIASGRNTLVAAPTGSGKTLTAFMTAIDGLVREGLAAGGVLPDETTVVYVSPLKALSNDIHLNLEAPLAGIRAELERQGLHDVDIRTAVRTGDTPQSERTRMRRKAPHILVTTPESLYVLLGSESGRAMLTTTRTVIVDEIHAVANSKRGSHLSLSLERLEALCGRRLTRVGLSATQKPVEEVARFLVGAPAVASDGTPDCEIVDIGYAKQRDLALELPPVPLQAVMSNEQWALVYARLAQLVQQHRTTLVFVNTRRMAERAARQLAETLGKDAVAAHHGSLSRELRLDAEQRLKRGELRVLVATASLELGIDIGDVDLVCQLGSPRTIAGLLQRVGRSGHHVGGVPKGRLFPQSRDDLVECAALLDCVRRGELDVLDIPIAPLDVLAQQIVAEVAATDWDEDALYDWMRRAWPYAQLARTDYDAVVRMLADGFTTRRGPRAAYVHRDAVNRRLRGRQGGRMIAVMSGGTIPDAGDYAVILEPQAFTIGNVNEDFAVESLAGDIFQLGNTSYRILRVEPGRVRVEDAQGAPPSIPFWLGEAPGRSDELSLGVSRLRAEIAARLEPSVEPLSHGAQRVCRAERGGGEGSKHDDGDDGLGAPIKREPSRDRGDRPETEPSPPAPLSSAHPLGAMGEGSKAGALASSGVERKASALASPAADSKSAILVTSNDDCKAAALAWMIDEVGLGEDAAGQLLDYVARQRVALGIVPTQDTIVIERFFDESGGTQLVIHTPYGSRINRAWGLALRKRFCRKFNFELQAAATEDAIVLSLSTSHSFPLIEVAHYLHSSSACDVLVQALLDAPLFGVRWRWNATTALALPRFSGGKKVAPQLQRMRSEDLLATVFPDQVACAENLVGEREVPDHPLVAQTLDDCLHEAMDADGWLDLLRRMESGEVQVVARDLTAPSPFAAEALNARPYAFLDDAPLEERRTQAVMSRRYADADSADDLGRLDPAAIESVRDEAWPRVRDADEMHEALMGLGVVTVPDVEANPLWPALLQQLASDRRATHVLKRVIPRPQAEGSAVAAGGEKQILRSTQDDHPGGLVTGNSTSEFLIPSPQAEGSVVAAGGEKQILRSTQDDHSGGLVTGNSTSELVIPRPQAEGSVVEATDGKQILRSAQDDSVGGLWVAAERLPQLHALFADATMQPPIEAPAEYAREPWSREDAALELVRSRLGGLGPVPVAVLAESLQLPTGEIDLALLRLETEGYVMRGRFTPQATSGGAEEWCERHLLARIHRYTIGRLRREIEPVEPRDFVRFLCDWQRVSPATRVSGPEALAGVLAQLEGFEAPAAAWESELLPARVGDYSISWLDDLCTAGRVAWARLRGVGPSTSGAEPGGSRSVRATPIVLLPRRQLSLWTRLTATRVEDEPALSSRAEKVAAYLAEHGASFFDELVAGAHLLRTELEDALAELVARGHVTCDSFSGLRALLVPGAKRPTPFARRGRRTALLGIEDAGRWTLTRRNLARHPRPSTSSGQTVLRTRGDPATSALTADAETRSLDPRVRGDDEQERVSGGDPASFAFAADAGTGSRDPRACAARPVLSLSKGGDDEHRQQSDAQRLAAAQPQKPSPEAIEHIARTLLRRYGVVFWRLLEREAAWLPSWRELLRVYHRLEARGEIRGGRFVAGLSGEQFALPDAIGALRAVRNREPDGALINLSASDPLNLVGTVLPGMKVPRMSGARVLYRDGLPVATLVAGNVEVLTSLSADDERAVRSAVMRDRERWEAPPAFVVPPLGDAAVELSPADRP